MTVVDPSVSTLASRRTSIPCDASRHAPTDRNKVSTIGNSSGIAAIARLTAPSSAAVHGSPRARLKTKSPDRHDDRDDAQTADKAPSMLLQGAR